MRNSNPFTIYIALISIMIALSIIHFVYNQIIKNSDESSVTSNVSRYKSVTKEQLNENLLTRGHSMSIQDIDISKDGRFIASGGADGHVIVWDVDNGEIVHHFEAHGDQVSSVEFSTDDRFLLTGGRDGKVKLISLNGDEIVSELSGHNGYVWKASYSPDDRMIATASHDGTIKLWDPGNRQLQKTLMTDEWSYDIAFAHDPRRLISSHATRTILWDIESGQILREFVSGGHEEYVMAVAISPTGEAIASGAGRIIVLWDMQSGEKTAELTGHQSHIRDIDFSTDGTLLLSCAGAGSAKLWNIKRLELIREFRSSSTINSAEFFSNRPWIAISSGNALAVFNRHTGEFVKELSTATSSLP